MDTNQNTAPEAHNRDRRTPGGLPHALSRTQIFGYDLAVLALLALLGALYLKFETALTSALAGNYVLVIKCAWFGALGGVIISLKGIYDHSTGADGWDRKYNLWHLGRPISGAIAGFMTVVLLMAINPGGNLTRPVAYAAAFIFGTQERRFFNLLYEVARLIVQVPEEAKAGLVLTDVQPTEGGAGSVIVVTGKGIESTATVKLGTATVEKLVVSSDGTTAAGIIPARPAGAETVDVSVVNAAGKSATLPAKFKFTG